MILIGVDTGGTFTDFVIFKNKTIHSFKLPSSPESPEKTILEGIKPYLNKDFILIHGTTVATNAFLENKMGKTALVTTKGFEDILRIGRQNRINLFSLAPQKAPEIIPDNLRFGIDERTLYSGKVKKSVNLQELIEIKAKLIKKNVRSVAFVFLHSYINGQNEIEASSDFHDDFHVTISSGIHPELREYERTVITVLNAALIPVMFNYINNLTRGINNGKLYITQSDGGLLPPEKVQSEPVYTLLSGPSGGITAARKVATDLKLNHLITFDMGGTSTDVSVIKGGRSVISKNLSLNGLPLGIPMIDIKTIGSGGGSIASVDSAGVLKVGPESAGADPGPACYGKSVFPTVTDAFVTNGIIRAENFLGGKMKIFPEKSYHAIGLIAKKLKKDINQTAEGIIQIAVSSIERALRSVTVEKGDDPREFTLMPFGGAGGLVAGMVAEKLNIKNIIFPSLPGVFSALGMIFAEIRKEFREPVLKDFTSDLFLELEEKYSSLEKKAFLYFNSQNKNKIVFKRIIEMKYRGQSNEIRIDYSNNIVREFHNKHKKLYTYNLDDKNIEISNVILIASKIVSEINPDINSQSKDPLMHKAVTLKVFSNGSFDNFGFFPRSSFSPGEIIPSPSIVFSDFSTIIIDKKYSAYIDKKGNLRMERK